MIDQWVSIVALLMALSLVVPGLVTRWRSGALPGSRAAVLAMMWAAIIAAAALAGTLISRR